VEKRTAHYPLAEIQKLVKDGLVHATKAALAGAAELDSTFDDMIYVVENLKTEDLHKSMTSHENDELWQDVYCYPAVEAEIYLKLQIVDKAVIISFKER
jgi:motility quorum-sensing regulator/GCU-specific mRNA interferase toxin